MLPIQLSVLGRTAEAEPIRRNVGVVVVVFVERGTTPHPHCMPAGDPLPPLLHRVLADEPRGFYADSRTLVLHNTASKQ